MQVGGCPRAHAVERLEAPSIRSAIGTRFFKAPPLPDGVCVASV
jgi:hypothetical protein